MKIEDRRKNKNGKNYVSYLSSGTPFEYDETILIKTDCSNCDGFNPLTGEHVCVPEKFTIKVLNAKLVIED